MELYLLRVDVELSWGYSVKVPSTSAAEPALLMPPPTTLVGALAKGVSHVLGERVECLLETDGPASYALKISSFIPSAHAGFKSRQALIPWSDLTRSYAVPFLQTQYRTPGKVATWFGVHASGKVYAPSMKVMLAYVVNASKAEAVLGSKWGHLLRKSSLCLSSLGSKEGLVSAEAVELRPLREVEEDIVETQFYAPLEAVEEGLAGRAMLEFWDPQSKESWRSSKKEVPIVAYVAPIDSESMIPATLRLRLKPSGVALTVDGAPSTTVVLLRRWLK